jgi:hypothetical protein
MAELSITALTDAILVIGIALTVARSGGGHWKDPERADDRHPAASRSALWTSGGPEAITRRGRDQSVELYRGQNRVKQRPVRIASRCMTTGDLLNLVLSRFGWVAAMTGHVKAGPAVRPPSASNGRHPSRASSAASKPCKSREGSSRCWPREPAGRVALSVGCHDLFPDRVTHAGMPDTERLATGRGVSGRPGRPHQSAGIAAAVAAARCGIPRSIAQLAIGA